MTCDEWLAKHATALPTHDRLTHGEHAAKPPALAIGDAGRAAAAALPRDSLRRAIAGRLDEQSFLRLRGRFADALGGSCIVRHVFNATYPSLERAFANTAGNCVPIVHLDFDHGMIADVEEAPFAAFRVSPNFVCAAGLARAAELSLAVAVVAKTFVENIEAVRAYVEVIIGDEDWHTGRKRSGEELVEGRTRIEERFVPFAPPKCTGGDRDGGAQWILGIERFLTDAGDPEKQPIEAIPWF
jgi:hypothetical protein